MLLFDDARVTSKAGSDLARGISNMAAFALSPPCIQLQVAMLSVDDFDLFLI